MVKTFLYICIALILVVPFSAAVPHNNTLRSLEHEVQDHDARYIHVFAAEISAAWACRKFYQRWFSLRTLHKDRTRLPVEAHKAERIRSPSGHNVTTFAKNMCVFSCLDDRPQAELRASMMKTKTKTPEKQDRSRGVFKLICPELMYVKIVDRYSKRQFGPNEFRPRGWEKVRTAICIRPPDDEDDDLRPYSIHESVAEHELYVKRVEPARSRVLMMMSTKRDLHDLDTMRTAKESINLQETIPSAMFADAATGSEALDIIDQSAVCLFPPCIADVRQSVGDNPDEMSRIMEEFAASEGSFGDEAAYWAATISHPGMEDLDMTMLPTTDDRKPFDRIEMISIGGSNIEESGHDSNLLSNLVAGQLLPFSEAAWPSSPEAIRYNLIHSGRDTRNWHDSEPSKKFKICREA